MIVPGLPGDCSDDRLLVGIRRTRVCFRQRNHCQSDMFRKHLYQSLRIWVYGHPFPKKVDQIHVGAQVYGHPPPNQGFPFPLSLCLSGVWTPLARKLRACSITASSGLAPARRRSSATSAVSESISNVTSFLLEVELKGGVHAPPESSSRALQAAWTSISISPRRTSQPG